MTEKEFLIYFCLNLAEAHLQRDPDETLVQILVELKYFDLPPSRAQKLRGLASRTKVYRLSHSAAAKAILMRDLAGSRRLDMLVRVFESRADLMGISRPWVLYRTQTYPFPLPYDRQRALDMARQFAELT